MPHIRPITTEDIIAGLPELIPLDHQLNDTSQRFSLLIASAGFEDRASAVVQRGLLSSFNHALVITYPTNDEENEGARRAFESNASECALEFLRYNREEFANNLTAHLSSVLGAKDDKVVVDVSGMSSYVIYPVLAVLLERFPFAKLSILYFEALDYCPTEEVWKDFKSAVSDLTDPLEMAERFQKVTFQAKGVELAYGSPLFPGLNSGTLATQLVVVPSFSLDRVKAMIAYAEQAYNASIDSVQWILGNPPNKSKHGWRRIALLELYSAEPASNRQAISTRSYGDMLATLQDIWESKHLERHLVLASVGSKMQHLGTFLFLCIHAEVGLVLSEPQEYDARAYSTGIGPAWWLEFGTISKLRELLQSYRSLQFSW
jgi:hypothetical protein